MSRKPLVTCVEKQLLEQHLGQILQKGRSPSAAAAAFRCLVFPSLFQTVFRPDITVMVGWALKINSLSIHPSFFPFCFVYTCLTLDRNWKAGLTPLLPGPLQFSGLAMTHFVQFLHLLQYWADNFSMLRILLHFPNFTHFCFQLYSVLSS